MRKTTILCSIFSAAILLSSTLLGPVNVKALNLETEAQVLNKINDVSTSLESEIQNNDNFAKLIELHNNKRILEIFNELKQANADEEIHKLVDEYKSLIDFNQLKTLSYELDKEYANDLNSIETSLKILYEGKETDEDLTGVYYKIEKKGASLKVTKQYNEDLPENALLVRCKDLSTKVGNGGWLGQQDYEKLKDFFARVGIAGVILMYLGFFITMIAEWVIEKGNVQLGESIYKIGVSVLVIGIIVYIAGFVGLIFLDWLENKDKSGDKSKTSINQILDFLRLKIIKFFNILFTRAQY